MPNGNPAPGPLNSRYFRPVRGKETRARRWDLQFESTSLQQRVQCEPNFLSLRALSVQWIQMTARHLGLIGSELNFLPTDDLRTQGSPSGPFGSFAREL